MRRVLLALAAVCLVCACHGGSSDVDRSPTRAAPTLGGASPTATPPSGDMDELEKPIAARLAEQVARQGLHVDHLDCPTWGGRVPVRMTCQGWFDNVKGSVRVRLSRDIGSTVAFDAMLERGVIATRTLVSELRSKGYDDVDCGTVPAYPTDVGSTITCVVTKAGDQKYVVATITDDRGGVTISDF